MSKLRVYNYSVSLAILALAVSLVCAPMGAAAQVSRPASQPPRPAAAAGQAAAKPTPAKRKTSADRRAERDSDRKKKDAAKSPADQRKADRDKKAAPAKPAGAPAAKAATTAISAPKPPPIPFLGDFSLLKSQQERMLRIHPKDAGNLQDLTVIVGQEFSTEISLDNPPGTPFDMIRVILSYEPDVIEPLAISDVSIASSLSGDPTSQVDTKAGIILYEAQLSKGFVSNSTPILTIRWKAKKVSAISHLEFGSRGDFATALLGEGKDLLGNPKAPNDGMLNMNVVVLPEDPREAEALLSEPTLMQGTDAKVGGITLTLTQPEEPVYVNQPFHVDIVLDNTAYSNADQLNVILTYNPEDIEVIDNDLDNWITLGRNVLDGPFHDMFPWDFQIENQVLQARGMIIYRMGAGDVDVTRGKVGPVARIYAIAKRPTAATGFQFRFSKQEQLHGTGVTYIGSDALGDSKTFGDGARGVTFPVLAGTPSEVASSTANSSAK